MGWFFSQGLFLNNPSRTSRKTIFNGSQKESAHLDLAMGHGTRRPTNEGQAMWSTKAPGFDPSPSWHAHVHPVFEGAFVDPLWVDDFKSCSQTQSFSEALLSLTENGLMGVYFHVGTQWLGPWSTSLLAGGRKGDGKT